MTDGSSKIDNQVRVTPKGIVNLAGIINAMDGRQASA
jgi:hypothetical protein